MLLKQRIISIIVIIILIYNNCNNYYHVKRYINIKHVYLRNYILVNKHNHIKSILFYGSPVKPRKSRYVKL